jgi:hypothetical protein
MNHTTVAIIMVVSAMVIVGTNLTPLIQRAQASVLSHPLKDSLKSAASENLHFKLEHKSQHLNQENLCYRSVVCDNSNVALQTLGNDNSVTGFADQSTNNNESSSETN